jgi:hypothetical protein|tara:strand:+ start:1940 stop:3139 length:1200 start_codon:yes stop_codon:yes gene_type:complete
MFWHFCALGVVLVSLSHNGFSAIDKVTSSTPLLLKTPSTAISEELLLDVSIPTLNDGLYLTDEDDTVFPEVRFAEAIYFANQLAKVMEKSGAWGAIRVTPNDQVITDVYITGTILHSDGETLELSVIVRDTKGQEWFAKTYKKVAGKLAYDRKSRNNLGDPFQNLFISIANDVLVYREKLVTKAVLDLRSISELRFAKQFSSDAFSEYLSEDKKGILTLERLPAQDDELLTRVQKIRQRDYLYIDTMQDYYDGFSQQMHFSYQEFRQSSYDSVVKARQLNRQGTRRIVAGIGSILAGIYGRTQADSRIAADASTATAAVGGFILKSGLEKKQKSAEYDESVAEMGSSLEAEIVPQVIALEDRTVTLTGTVQAQYTQWQELMAKIYQQERGSLEYTQSIE